MTRILLISPSRELFIKDIPVFDNNDVKKIKDFIENTKSEYGNLERIIITRGTVRLMGKDEEIPVPSVSEKAQAPYSEQLVHTGRKPRTEEELSQAAKDLWDQRMNEGEEKSD